MKRINETGKRYNQWTVLGYIEPKDRLPENRNMSYLAQCSCGTIRPVRIGDLKSGKSKCCGCLNKKNWSIEIGKTYGEITVLERLKNRHGNFIQRYKCKCSCGTEVIWPADYINKKKNCGCQFMKGFDIRQDLTGRQFGRLKVIKMSDRLDRHGKKSYAICKCECGNVCEMYRGHLKNGHTVSCGCLRSYGEEWVASFLKEKQIEFQREYKFLDLFDKDKLRFDFAIFKDNKVIALIEIQGKQHYTDDLLFSSDYLLKHDKMKEEYCKKNNIPFLRINYSNGRQNTNFKNWELLLTSFLEEVIG